MDLQLKVLVALMFSVAVGYVNPVMGLLAFLGMVYTGFDPSFYPIIVVIAFVGILFSTTIHKQGESHE